MILSNNKKNNNEFFIATKMECMWRDINFT